MQPRVQFITPHGQPVWVGPGALIGRLATADVQVPDPRVSEAHALVSLRVGRLVLLALRRQFRVRGESREQLPLVAGDRIELAPGVVVAVAEVNLPTEVFALSAGGQPQFALNQSVYHLTTDNCGRVEYHPGFSNAALAHVWAAGETWWLQLAREQAISLEEGDTFLVDGIPVRVETSRLRAVSVPATVTPRGRHDVELLVYKNYIVLQRGNARARFSGRPAAVLLSLSRYDEGVPWEILAREVWDSGERQALRQNWDRVIYRIRTKLREVGLPDHLLHGDGSGNFQLRLTEESESSRQ